MRSNNKHLNRLRLRYLAASAAYTNCVQAASASAATGERQSARMLAKVETALAELTDARERLLQALLERARSDE